MSFAKTGRTGGPSAANRRTAVIVAVVSAVLAAALIYLFVQHYRKPSPPAAPKVTTVWVATKRIPLGTPEPAAAAAGLFKQATVPVSKAVSGALTDPSLITADAASVTIVPGQQLTSGDWTPASDTIAADLKGTQRAVAFSLDAEHGLTSFLQPGNTVDVMGVSGATSTLLDQKIPILYNGGGLVVLNLTDRQALLLTAATGNYALWLSLRPSIGAKDSVKVGSVGK